MRTPRCAGRRRDSGWVRFVVAVGISPALFASACSSSTQSRSQSSSTKAESRTTSTTHTRTKHPFRCKGTGAASFDAKTKSFVGDWTHATCTHLGVTRHPFKVTPGSNDRSFTLTGANGDTPSGTSTETTTPVGPNTLKATDHLTVTGGTGLFAGATGSLRSTGTTTFLPGTPVHYRIDFIIVGTISY